MIRKSIIFCVFTAIIALSATSAFGQFYSKVALRSDLRTASASAYVNVTAVAVDPSSPNFTECAKGQGIGYCSYRLSAEVKEVFKGKIVGGTIVFFTTTDADYKQNNLLGERVVFLVKGKAKRFETIENSSRRIEEDVLIKMRSIKRTKKKI